MAIHEDVKTKTTDEAPPEAHESGAADDVRASTDVADEGPSPLVPSEGSGANDDASADEGALAPTQLGAKRYVYAAYFAGGIAVAFFTSKLGEMLWQRLSTWKPQFGEPRGEIIMPISAIIGVVVALYYWRQARTRELAEEVASELSKVTWPTKDEVVQSTAVVIVATLFSTVFFALMDRFWGFLTNLVYGT